MVAVVIAAAVSRCFVQVAQRRQLPCTRQSDQLLYLATDFNYTLPVTRQQATQILVSITLNSRLKTVLFRKYFPLQPFCFFFRTDYTIPLTFTVTSKHISFYVLVFFCFTLFSCRFRALE